MKVSTRVMDWIVGQHAQIAWSTKMQDGLNSDWRIHLVLMADRSKRDCLVLDYGEKHGFAVYRWEPDPS